MYYALLVVSVSTEKFAKISKVRRDARVVELARLERVYSANYPGFESLSLRQNRTY